MLLNKIDEKSPNSVTSGLDLFSFPETNVSLSKSYYKEFSPYFPITDSPYLFKIPSTSSFLDFKHMYLFTEWQMKVTNAAGTNDVNTQATDNCSTIQAFGSNFIRNVKVYVADKEVFNANNLYAFKNFFDTELNYSMDAKRSHLAVTGYRVDNLDDPNLAAGQGFIDRKNLFLGGNRAQFITKINADIFNIDKYFLNNTEVEIAIYPHDVNFVTQAPGLAANRHVTMTLRACKLHVLYHDLVDGLALSFANQLAKPFERVKYALRGTEMKTIFVDGGRNSVDVNLFNGKIPRRLTIGMLSRGDFDGDRATSPFNFKNFDLRNIRVLWNGLENPSIAYDLNFGADRYVRAYHDMQAACGFAFSPYSNGITMTRFKESSCIFVFNLTANLEDEKGCELIRHGTTTLRAQFGTNIPVGGMTMIIYAEFDSLMKIDNDRNITTDLTA